MNFNPCIRWSGGKRKQSEDIVNRMPYKMGTCYIPFLGGGSVMYQLLNSNVKFDRIVASDIYAPLMGIWYYIQNDVETLYESYCEYYEKLMQDSNYYQEVVDKFNMQSEDEKDPLLFHFITRTCMRGSIEFDRYGNFITKLHSRGGETANDGITTPESLWSTLSRWSEAIVDVEFRCESYECILDDVAEDDYCFFDPPYIDGTWYKDNQIDMDEFYDFLRQLPCDYSITLNGDKEVYPIPEDLYTMHEYIYYGVNRKSASRGGKSTASRDSFWMNHKHLLYDSKRVNCRNNVRPTGGKIMPNSEDKILFDLHNRFNVMEQKIDKILEIVGGK